MVEGRKNNKGKPMWSLLPFRAVNEIVKVLDCCILFLLWRELEDDK